MRSPGRQAWLSLGKPASEKRRAEEMAGLHLRTIEALALAIEAKDEDSHRHIRRVRVYAVELGKQLGLPRPELQALRAASILRDIGKLAVPAHIVSKPGKLTPEEFDKMKIHPVVGAEILSRVEFPYPVVPIVRAHHERWDGTGYPDGLERERIPIGARILAAVDCLSALASDRQYRRALPLDEAMAAVAAEAGRSYDERVIAALMRNYRCWEELASAAHGALAAEATRPEFPASIASARREVQTLYELTRDLGNSLNLHETISALDTRLKRLIPYDAIVVYMRKDERLAPAYVNGENARLLASLEIALGQGLAGRVAETGKPIVNGNPSVDPSGLRSALAVPLGTAAGTSGVLALYKDERDAFNKDHLRVLLAINPKISLAIENTVRYEQAAMSAGVDDLTSLPNARALFPHLDAELARCGRGGTPLAVLVSDLDGFKQVNDRFGHLEGNRALRLVAAGLRDCCREYDYVARMGGDEFVLVLPGFRPEDLEAKLARIAGMVRDVGVAVCREPLLGISAGAGFYPESGSDAESLLAEADRRMYLAKQSRKAAAPRCAEALAALHNALAAPAPRETG